MRTSSQTRRLATKRTPRAEGFAAGGRLLVLHPDLGLQAVLAVILARQWVLETASDPAEMVTPYVPPDVVLLDGGLVDLHGSRWLDRLRDRAPACFVIPIVGPEDRDALRLVRGGRLETPLPKPLRLRDLLTRLARIQAPCAPVPGVAVGQAIEYLAGHYAERLEVAAIAAAAELSPSRLAHRFPPETGLAVKAFVARLRIEIAKRMLAERDLPLERVAELTGFADASHLSRAFQRYVRHRPGAYRLALGTAGSPPARHVLFLPAHGRAAVLSIRAAALSIVRRGSLG